MAERKFHTENSGHRTLWKHRHEYELCQEEERQKKDKKRRKLFAFAPCIMF